MYISLPVYQAYIIHTLRIVLNASNVTSDENVQHDKMRNTIKDNDNPSLAVVELPRALTSTLLFDRYVELEMEEVVDER